MAIRYIVVCKHFDHFTGNEYTHYGFENLQKAFAFYKHKRMYDFDYEDAYRNTHIYATHNDAVELKPQRQHARTKEEWLSLNELFPIERKYIGESVIRDVEPTAHTDEDDYVFDDDSWSF